MHHLEELHVLPKNIEYFSIAFFKLAQGFIPKKEFQLVYYGYTGACIISTMLLAYFSLTNKCYWVAVDGK